MVRSASTHYLVHSTGMYLQCCRVDTAAGLLPDALELDERSSWDASDDVLQLVSGRQVRPVPFSSSQHMPSRLHGPMLAAQGLSMPLHHRSLNKGG